MSTHSGSGDGASESTQIQHIVVIFGENVSFDHYFGTYPVAANRAGEPVFTATPETPVPDGLRGSLLTANPNVLNTRNGPGATNPFRLDHLQAATADQNHGYSAEQMAFDNRAMDLFPLAVGRGDPVGLATQTGASKTATTRWLTMGYYDGNTVTALWNYAQHYALNDHSFGTNFGPSTVGAINLISGQTNGAAPLADDSAAVVSDGNRGLTLISDAEPKGDVCDARRASVVAMTGKNIGDLLTAANITWGWFQGGFDLTVTDADGRTGCRRATRSPVTGVMSGDYNPIEEPFQFYASTQNLQHTRPTAVTAIGTNNDGANHQYDLHDFTDALAAGNLPAVSFLKAPEFEQGHAGFSDPLDEQRFIVDLVNAIERSKLWPSTAIIVAYDDSDGWYDHVNHVVNGSATSRDTLSGAGECKTGDATADSALPGIDPATEHAQGRCGYGPRLPLMVISPWAKKNYIDSTVTDQTSVLRFIEDVFLGGRRIGGGSFDSMAGSLNNMFDFSQSSPPNPNIVLLNDTTGEVTSNN
ncbi:MAG TPA: alkaline phosphatase family protein [Acidobacteriaceae bacterium]